jgi:uncharacterized membrane protein
MQAPRWVSRIDIAFRDRTCPALPARPRACGETVNKMQWTHRLFRIGVLLKGVDGALEIFGGFLQLFVTSDSIHSVVWMLTEREISKDPTDAIAGLLRHATDALTLDTKTFASMYLVFHGVIKLFLVVSLLRELKWAFPVALWFLGVFTVYQLYRFAHTHSIALLAFSVIDLFVMWMVWREYAVRQSTGTFGGRTARIPMS